MSAKSAKEAADKLKLEQLSKKLMALKDNYFFENANFFLFFLIYQYICPKY
jgi:hypothetical protein